MEKVVEVPVEKIREVPVEKIVQVPVDVIVENPVTVQKVIEKNVYVDRLVRGPRRSQVVEQVD